MNEHVLRNYDFKLIFEFEITEDDVKNVCTVIRVLVETKKFSADAFMNVEVDDLIKFIKELNDFYCTLKGTARINEICRPAYVSFTADKRGHIIAEGCLYDAPEDSEDFSFRFRSEFDQTFLKPFVEGLLEEIAAYL